MQMELVNGKKSMNNYIEELQSMDDGKIKVKQLVVSLTQHPWLKYNSRIKEIELWNDSGDFHFYTDSEEIHIEHDGVMYLCELFFDAKTPNMKIVEVSKLVNEKMIEYFQKQIDKFTSYITEIKRQH